MKMKAKVVSVQSGSTFVDKKRRVTLKFEDADSVYNEIRIPDADLELDQMVDVELEISYAKIPGVAQ
jgi:hypothetical protein